MSEIERMFKLHGHRVKAAMERLNELGSFGGQVFEACEEWGWELSCPTWGATATFTDAIEYGDGDDEGTVGRYANVTVFCVASGGQLLPSFVPHNYTAQVWCDLTNGEGKEEFLMRLDDLEAQLEEFATAIAGALDKMPEPVGL